MRPSFNTTGPCFPDEHYMLPPERRLGRVMELVDDGKYFTLQAGRQTGKTTSARWLVRHYAAGQRFRAIWVDVQEAREQPDPAKAFRTVVGALDFAVAHQLKEVGPPAESAGSLHDPFWLGTTSPFNITAEATSLGPFSAEEVAELLAQHTARTGQRFEPGAAAMIHDLSQGHPWLVNALADHIVDRALRDRSLPVTPAHVEAAKEAIILARHTHIDSPVTMGAAPPNPRSWLLARLREPRVRRILDPMLAGGDLPGDVLDDDVAYVIGLGILRVVRGEYVVANPIYREVIPRALTSVRQHSLHQPTEWYVQPDGALDMPKIMERWQTFWREDGHLAAEGFGYRESGPHLMLMAFLQRIVNGGGRIDREYGLGRGALDLVVTWQGARHVLELKLRRDTQTEARALDQVAGYLDRAGLDEGWLVMFDLRATRPWSERLTRETVERDGKRIHVVGC